MKNKAFIVSATLGILGLFMLTSTSVLFYYTFYTNYIPSLVKDQQIYFTPSSCVVALSGLNLKKDQKYAFSLKLKVDESPHNFDIGNFLVKLEIRNHKNISLSEMVRPGLVKWKSPLLQGINTLTSLSLLLGYSSQSQLLNIPLLENYSPKNGHDFFYIQVDTKELHIQDSILGVKTYLRGLRYFMYEWKVVTGILMVSLILVTEIMGLWGLYITLKDFYNKNLLQNLQGNNTQGPQSSQKRLKLKKKKSTLSKKSSEETVTARFDSSYASLHTTTPEEKDVSRELGNIRNAFYPESPSPWDTFTGSGSGISLENNEDLEDDSSHFMDSTMDITMESMDLSIKEDDISKKDVKEKDSKEKDLKKDLKEGTSYSFFPSGASAETTAGNTNASGSCAGSKGPNVGTSGTAGVGSGGARASSYSMSFSAVSLNGDEEINEAVNSWRDGLEGDWND